VARVRREIANAALRDDLIELIETVIIYKLARLNREEIQAMLEVHDIRETRVYRDALEEGEKKGMARAIVRLCAKKMSVEEIVAILEVDADFVREALNGRTGGSS
jgi:predicted transposase YdaD